MNSRDDYTKEYGISESAAGILSVEDWSGSPMDMIMVVFDTNIDDLIEHCKNLGCVIPENAKDQLRENYERFTTENKYEIGLMIEEVRELGLSDIESAKELEKRVTEYVRQGDIK